MGEVYDWLQVRTHLVGELLQRGHGQHQRLWPALGAPLWSVGCPPVSTGCLWGLALPGGASARQRRVPKARVSSRMPAELSNAANSEQERYRGYRVQRLLAARAVFCSKVDFDAAGAPVGPLLAPEVVMQRLAALTTSQLERRLAHVYHSPLVLSTPQVSRTSTYGP